MKFRKQDYFIFTIAFIIAFIILCLTKPQYVPFKIAIINNSPVPATIDSIQWKTKYGFNDIQKFSFETSNSSIIYSNLNSIIISNINTSNINYHYNIEITDNTIKPLSEISVIEVKKDSSFNLNKTNIYVKMDSVLLIKTKNNISDVYISSAIFPTRLQAYTRAYKINSTYTNLLLLMYVQGFTPVTYSLNNQNILSDFHIPFVEYFPKNFHFFKTLALIIASMIWGFITTLFLQYIYQNPKKTINHNLILFIVYTTVLLLLFNSLGSYWRETHKAFAFLFDGQYKYHGQYDGFMMTFFMPNILHYTFGIWAYGLQWIIPYSLASVLFVSFFTVKYKLIYLLPIMIVVFVPPFSLLFTAALWKSSLSGLWIIVSFLLLLKGYYTPKIRNQTFSFSILSSMIATLYREEFLLYYVFILIFTSLLSKKFKLVTTFSLLIIFVFPMLTPIQRPKYQNNIAIMFFAPYIHRMFYKEDFFDKQEKENLGISADIISIFAKKYDFQDSHNFYPNLNIKLRGKDLIFEVIKTFFRNPIPFVYSKFITLRNLIFPYYPFLQTGHQPGRVINISNTSDSMDYPVKQNGLLYQFGRRYLILDSRTSVFKIQNLFISIIMIIIQIITFVTFTKNPLTAIFNFINFLYMLMIVMLMHNVPGGFYLHGMVLFALISPFLMKYERSYKNDHLT